MTTQTITNTGRRDGAAPTLALRCPKCGATFNSHTEYASHVFDCNGRSPDGIEADGRRDAATLESDWGYVCGCGARFASATAYALHAKDCPQGNYPDIELVWVVVNGFDLALFPWEDAQAAVAEAEAILQEKDAKPGYGLEVDVLPWEVADEPDETTAWLATAEEPDELALMAADLDALRLGLVKPLARLTKAQMDEIERERIGADFCESPWVW